MVLEEKIIRKLQEKQLTITTAESCTGGLLAGRLLNVSGASDVYEEGYITYANASKERLLGVSPETLMQFGAVSPQTAKEMAKGAAFMANAVIGLSTTGIAGPGGGSSEKPVGLVYVACAVSGVVTVEKHLFSGNREENRNAAVEAALQLLWRILDSV